MKPIRNREPVMPQKTLSSSPRWSLWAGGGNEGLSSREREELWGSRKSRGHVQNSAGEQKHRDWIALLYIAMELSWFILSSPDKETMLSRCLGSASQPPGLEDGLCMLEGILQIVRIWYWIYANLFSPKGAAQSAQWSHVRVWTNSRPKCRVFITVAMTLETDMSSLFYVSHSSLEFCVSDSKFHLEKILP